MDINHKAKIKYELLGTLQVIKSQFERLKKNTQRETTKVIKKIKRLWYTLRLTSPSKCTYGWFVQSEINYGGLVNGIKVHGIKQKEFSKYNDDNSTLVSSIDWTGGDRMLDHNYAPKYVEYLTPIYELGKKITLVEVGILRGSGLAMWCDLFPQGRVIGLDIDLNNIKNNMFFLKRRGAFKNNTPELYEFDQFENNEVLIGEILQGNRIDVFIDDGIHSNESILKTFESAKKHLSSDFIYIIEDNKEIHAVLKKRYPEYSYDCLNELTIVTP